MLHVAVRINDIGIAQRCHKTAQKKERASGIFAFAISGKIMRKVLQEGCIVRQGMQLLKCPCVVYSTKKLRVKLCGGFQGVKGSDGLNWDPGEPGKSVLASGGVEGIRLMP